MKVAVFSTKPYDSQFFNEANGQHQHELHFLEPRLNLQTVPLAEGVEVVCVFTNDVVNAGVLKKLSCYGVKLIALRCAGFNNVDLKAAEDNNISVVRVPAYSPYAVAEHTVSLMMSLNRHLHRAYNRVREGNFSLDGLMGFDLHGKTVGLIGTGKIGAITAQILKGFGCKILAYDLYQNKECIDLGVEYVEMRSLFYHADVISLHCPLTPKTHHLINANAIAQMKPGVMLVNTSRGALVDTLAVIDGLKSGQIGSVGLDVYEEEEALFFENLSETVIQDDVFTRLLTFPNVLITGHQAFFTREAMTNIADVTLQNITDFSQGKSLENQVVRSK